MANIFQKLLFRQPQTFLVKQSYRSFYLSNSIVQQQCQQQLLKRSLISTQYRMLFTYQQQTQLAINNRLLQLNNSHTSFTNIPMANFSLKIRRRKARRLEAEGGKYKLKTKKAFQKRFKITGTLRDRKFKYQAIGYHHLNRNKSRRNLATKRKGYFLTCKGNIKLAKKLAPYFKRRKYLKC